MNDAIKSTLCVILLVLCAGIVGYFDKADQEIEQKNYCEMVKIWESSKGQYGWPAYNGEEACNE